MDPRFETILQVLTMYSLGQFDSKIPSGDKDDELDAFSQAINMMGDELAIRTIQRDFFTSIFDSVSELILVSNHSLKIIDVNAATEKELGHPKSWFLGKRISEIFPFPPMVEKEEWPAAAKIAPSTFNTTINVGKGNALQVEVNVTEILGEKAVNQVFLFTARDRWKQIETEQRVISAVMDTEEAVRKKTSQDLHDSIGQQISAMIMSVNVLQAHPLPKEICARLSGLNDDLQNFHQEIHDICFDLAPQSLAASNLLRAARELARQYRSRTGLHLKITSIPANIRIPQRVEINIFRIVQEFVNNAARHGSATKVTLSIVEKSDSLTVLLEDNGMGFDITKSVSNGFGLRNAQFRAETHGGHLTITSSPSSGTSFHLTIPKPYANG